MKSKQQQIIDTIDFAKNYPHIYGKMSLATFYKKIPAFCSNTSFCHECPANADCIKIPLPSYSESTLTLFEEESCIG